RRKMLKCLAVSEVGSKAREGGPELPRRIGKYDILCQIGSGGMAEILLGRVRGIEGFEKPVVLKRIHPRLARNEILTTMFIDEARLAATLHHSNIGEVYDFGKTGNDYFLAMEYLRGADVGRLVASARVKNTRIPLEHAIAIVLGAAT